MGKQGTTETYGQSNISMKERRERENEWAWGAYSRIYSLEDIHLWSFLDRIQYYLFVYASIQSDEKQQKPNELSRLTLNEWMCVYVAQPMFKRALLSHIIEQWDMATPKERMIRLYVNEIQNRL